jgi:hypothetical protein
MFEVNFLKRVTASLFTLLFLTFLLTTALLTARPALAVTIPGYTSTTQDHSAHSDGANEKIEDDYQAQKHTATAMASHTNNACAALCQTSTTTKPTLLLPNSEKEKDDDIFYLEDDRHTYCPKPTDDSKPVYKERELKVPLYIKNCLLRI